MSHEAVITGLGVVSPAGIGVTHFWQGVQHGQSFISPITNFDTSKFVSKVAGIVPDFQASDYLDPRIIAQTDRWTQFDLVCAGQAIADAGIAIRDENAEKIGAVFAAGTGGNGFGQQQLHICSSKGPNYASAYLSIAWFYAASLGQVSIRHGIRGYGRNICAEAAGGLLAIAHAAKIIARDVCEIVIVGGCDAPLIPYTFAAHQSSGLISSDSGPSPYRPFDATRSGTIVGEGGAGFCIEQKEHALQRASHIYAEIVGWGQSFDGILTREPASNGEEYARAMSQALIRAKLQPADIDWIICDGLGTQNGDIAEVKALQLVFGKHLRNIPASAPKSMFGRLFNGSSTTDVLMGILGMNAGVILPTVGYTRPDPQCQIDCVPNQARKHAIQHILIGARGFGGFNSTLILRRFS